MLDGRYIGNVHEADADYLVQGIWHVKISWIDPNVPASLEIGYIPPTERYHDSHNNMMWPGIFFFTTPAWFVRGVFNLSENGIEWIGPLE